MKVNWIIVLLIVIWIVCGVVAAVSGDNAVIGKAVLASFLIGLICGALEN